jgi:hypothetical protein
VGARADEENDARALFLSNTAEEGVELLGTIPDRFEFCRQRRDIAVGSAVDYAKFRSRSLDAVIRVYDEAGNLIETHEHKDEFQEW